MKKRAAAWLLVTLLVIALSSLAFSEREKPTERQKASFVLPASLQTIGEEAFSGTAAESVVLPYGFLHLERKAFDRAVSLTDIYIPPTIESIGENALPRSRELTVHGVSGSRAQTLAEEHGLSFAAVNVLVLPYREGKTGAVNRLSVRFSPKEMTENVVKLLRKAENVEEERSMRPQDRPELNPIDYRFP